MNGQLHATTALLSGRQTSVRIGKEAGWPQNPFGPGGDEKKNSPLPLHVALIPHLRQLSPVIWLRFCHYSNLAEVLISSELSRAICQHIQLSFQKTKIYFTFSHDIFLQLPRLSAS